MRITPLHLGALLLLFVPSLLRGQVLPSTASATASQTDIPAPPPIRDATAAQYITKLAAQHGVVSPQAINATITTKIEYWDGKHASHTMKLLGGDMVKHETEHDGKTVISVRASGKGTRTKGGKLTAEPLWVTESSHPDLFPIGDIIVRHSNLTMNEEFLGNDSEAGRPLIHIRMTKPLSQPEASEKLIYQWDLFIDPETMLLARSRSWIFSPTTYSNASELDVDYSDYRKVDGLMVPFTSVVYIGHRKVKEERILSATMSAQNTIADFN